MMNERIAALAEKTIRGEMYAYQKKTEYSDDDLALSKTKRSAKRVCEYIRTTINTLAKSLPPHRVVPFNNIGKEDQTMSK